MTIGGLSPRQRQLIAALSFIGIFLRFTDLARSYWFDELATLNSVDMASWLSVLEITSRDNQPPLYNSLLFLWIHAFGLSEMAVRALSVIFGLLALGTPWLARRSLTTDQKLLCCALLCLMPLPIRYTQEARNYSLLLLLSATCLFCYYEMLVTRSQRLRSLFYLSLLLLAGSHLFGLLLAVCFLAVMFWQADRWATRLLLAAYAAALSALVLIPLLHGGSGHLAGGHFWITFSAASLLQQLLMVVTPAGLLLLFYGLMASRRAGSRAAPNSALMAALAPFALMLAGSIAISLNTPIITDRNLIGLIPACALLAAWLLQPQLQRGELTVVLPLLGLAALQAVVLVFSPLLFIQEDFRAIARESVTDGSKVCYVVNDGTTVVPYIYSFYVVKRFGRPDLTPEEVRRSAIPQAEPQRYGCRLWADATLPKRGEFVLARMPQFAGCRNISLSRRGGRPASELLDCGG